MKLLKPLLASSDKAVKESAGKLLEKIKAEATGWLADAQKNVETDPVAAYDICQRVAAMFDPADELAKNAAAQLATLKDKKPIKDELEARKLYSQLEAAVARATLAQRSDLVAFCKRAAEKYPDTPTGKKIAAFGEAVGRLTAQ
jgi:hypothetical protein